MTLPITATDQVFEKTVATARSSATVTSEALRNLALREWFLGRDATVAGVASWSGDPNDLEGIADALNHDSLGQEYAEVMVNAASAGQATACKLQSDYLASAERAMRLRHLSQPRAAMHAASRRLGHGLPLGILGRVVMMAQDALTAGNLE